LVTVPAHTVLGGDEPGHLAGYGPVDARTCRQVAGAASSLTRVLTDPVTGALLGADGTYVVSGARRRFLAARDETCRFPGCNRSTTGCDVDHTVEWAAGGCSDEGNTAHLCRNHHRLKHRTRWRLTQDVAGTLTWTSPTGRVLTTTPVLPLPPAPPPPPPAPEPVPDPWAGPIPF
ncbi:HNH endonuclease signature motif containing protein, partial [Cellulomonas marina]|uniref:HNH endonuclease signature motif containing protein n=1 Tax=Cellulomonas marina TaxID=988821 RepID=UPI001940949D